MERRIAFNGPQNFRDLGGYRTGDGRTVRWRHLFRSDSLHGLQSDDLARARDELRLATQIDLRSAAEIQPFGCGPLANAGLRYQHIPLVSAVPSPRDQELAETAAGLLTLYRRMLIGSGAQFAAVLTTLARPEAYPAVFHCTGGRDRTGLVAAVVLGVLGVLDEEVVRDYALSSRYVDGASKRFGDKPLPGQGPGRTVHAATPAIMAAVLTEVKERYGSMRGYAEWSGVRSEDLHRLQDLLLTQA